MFLHLIYSQQSNLYTIQDIIAPWPTAVHTCLWHGTAVQAHQIVYSSRQKRLHPHILLPHLPLCSTRDWTFVNFPKTFLHFLLSSFNAIGGGTFQIISFCSFNSNKDTASLCYGVRWVFRMRSSTTPPFEADKIADQHSLGAGFRPPLLR